MILGESEANEKYQLFAQKAQDEGFSGVALLFKALSAAERIHIKNHRSALKEEFTVQVDSSDEVQSTLENLQNAVNGEYEETKKLYPQLMKGIKKELKTLEGKVANLSLQWAMDAELKHYKLLKKALNAVLGGTDLTLSEIYICKVCGNLILPEEKAKECELCGHDTIFFKRIEA